MNRLPGTTGWHGVARTDPSKQECGVRYRLMASYRGSSYQAGVGPSSSEVTLFAVIPPPEEHGFDSASGHWRKEVRIGEIDALWESRPVGSFHGEPCLVLDDLGDRLHIAYLGMDEMRASQLGYWQVDRGVFEVVVPRAEVADLAEERHEFPLSALIPALPSGRGTAGPAETAAQAVYVAPDSGVPGSGAPGAGVPGSGAPGAGAPGAPGASAPAYGAPGASAPGAPAYGAPGASAPAYGAPAASVPAYGAPAASVPAYGAPGYGPQSAAAPPTAPGVPAGSPAMAPQAPSAPSAPPVPAGAAAWHGSPEEDNGTWYPRPSGNGAYPNWANPGNGGPGVDTSGTLNGNGAVPAGAGPASDGSRDTGELLMAPVASPPARSERPGPDRPGPDRQGPGSDRQGAVVRGRRAARKPRVATQSVFADLLDLANIPRSSYAVDEEVSGAMCLIKTGGGFEVFSCADDARHEVRFFEDEEAAYFYLFGVLAAEALRNGRLTPQ
jgi:hypothetical protein